MVVQVFANAHTFTSPSVLINSFRGEFVSIVNTRSLRSLVLPAQQFKPVQVIDLCLIEI